MSACNVSYRLKRSGPIVTLGLVGNNFCISNLFLHTVICIKRTNRTLEMKLAPNAPFCN